MNRLQLRDDHMRCRNWSMIWRNHDYGFSRNCFEQPASFDIGMFRKKAKRALFGKKTSSYEGILFAALMLLLWGGSQILFAAEPILSEAQFREHIYRMNVQPHWLPDETAFWYHVRTGADTLEYVLVNAETETRKSGETLQSLGISKATETRTSTLPRTTDRKTGHTGVPCRVTFQNVLKSPVSLYWINPSGERIFYRTVASNDSLVQNTFEGHVWLLIEDGKKRLGIVKIDPFMNRILIDGAPEPLPEDNEAQPRPAPPSGIAPDGTWQAQADEAQIVLTNLMTNEKVDLPAALQAGARYFGEIRWNRQSDAFVISATVPVQRRQVSIVETSPQDQVEPKTIQFDYVKPGDPLPQPAPVLFHLVDGQFQQQEIENTLFPNQFTSGNTQDYRWSEDGREFYFDYNQRGHQCYRILAVNANTGAVRSIVEETSPTFIDYQLKSWRHWGQADKTLLWLSERDGWCHLWRYDVSGSTPPRQLTSGNWVVRKVLAIDDPAGTIWFTASGLRPEEDPYHIHLCRVQDDGTGFQQLTTGDGDHDIQFSPGRKYFLDTWSRIDCPPVTELRRTDNGRLICEVERADISSWLAMGGNLPERFVAKGRDGKTDIYGVIFKPSNFNPEKKYPVVENVYAGPHAAFAPRKFGELKKRQDLAEQGFIVVQADGMGTNFRGKAFHDVCWKNLKDAGFPDRIAWIKAAASTRPWMDLSRVGIYGGSAGGQSAMRALLDHADFYHVAVADCGCHDNRMDKIWWNEQWMGWPVDEGYRQSSNVEDADRLQGQLLLIVGELDHNVDPASTYQVVAALQRARKSFSFMPIMNTGHGAAETKFGSRLRQEFLIEHLRP